MTTELTLREKVLRCVARSLASKDESTIRRLNMYGAHQDRYDGYALSALDAICNALDATGAPAYIRVADDLRGVVREEGE